MSGRPTIPPWIRGAQFLPHYKNIYSLLAPLPPADRTENESRLYATETLEEVSHWDGSVLFLAKDAAPATTFERLIKNGDRRPWRAAERRLGDRGGVQTNENLLGFIRGWKVRGLYGSLMANLLRNDGEQSGPLPGFDDPRLVRYVRDVLEFVVRSMTELRCVICIGDDAWEHLAAVAGGSVVADQRRAAPVQAVIGGKSLVLFRMFHTSRMFAGGRPAREAEWQAVAKQIGAT